MTWGKISDRKFQAAVTRYTRRSAISQLSRLFPYIKERRWLYARGVLYLLLTNAFALLIPWIMKLAVESLEFPDRAVHSSGWYAVVIIAAAVAHGGIRILSRTAFLNSGRGIEFQLRKDLYERLLSLDLPFFSLERTGDILSRFSNDLTNVRMLCGFGFLNVVNTIILYIAALALMIRISPLLTAASLVPFVLMIMSVKRLSHRMFDRSTEVQEELAALSSKIEENVSAAVLVRTYCRENSETAAFADICERYRRRSLDLAALRGIIIPIMGMASGAGTLIVLFWGGSRVISGALTLGDFVAFNGYLTMLIWPTVMMGWILNLMQRGAASMVRLNAILEAQPVVTEPAEPVVPETIRGGIELKGLSFSHGERKILHDVNLSIRPGMKVGIAGEVGSGKSTLVRLVARLLPAAEGTVFLDGVDVNRIPLRTLRESIGYVPQESFLFSRSIYENIAFGLEGADREQITRAAEMARLHEDVERFPQKYDTVVGERGLTLSGGQKQRTSIARALVKDPPVLILDDPLSAVDAETEEEILRGLERFYADRTVLVISHRLSAFRGCDHIIVLKEGRIVEQGSEAELLAREGLYAEIQREQQLRKEILEVGDEEMRR